MMNNKQELLIHLKRIDFQYPGRPEKVIANLDLKLFRGDRVGIIAPNGSGKTTLLHLIMGLIKPDAGRIEIFGNPMKTEKDFVDVRKKVGLLFQDADDQLFCPTVLEDVAFGPLNMGKKPDQAKSIAVQTLNQLGLIGFEDRITCKLSGGEKRMVALATILAMQPEILLLDEPSAGLDEKTKAHLISVLAELNLAFILISHENEFLYELASTFYAMEEGRLHPTVKKHRHFHSHPHHTHGHSEHTHDHPTT